LGNQATVWMDPVVHMGDDEIQRKMDPSFNQELQQSERIGAARDSDQNALTVQIERGQVRHETFGEPHVQT
jgi:hypothetical protein